MSREMYGHGSVYRQSRVVNGARVYGRIWWIAYSVRGVQHCESSGSSERKLAVKLLKRRLAESANGKVIAPKAERLTLAAMLDDLETDYRDKGNRQLRSVERARAHLERFFGAETRAIDITRNRLQEYVQARKAHPLRHHGALKPTSNGTINRELAALRRAFAVAVINGKLTRDYCPAMPMLEEAEPRAGFLEPHQFAALVERLPDYLRLPVRFLWATGWRLGAMRTREWERDCELQRDERGTIIGGTLYLDRAHSKNKEAWPLPISGELLEILRAADAQRDPNCPFIFHRDGSRLGDFRKAWRRACAPIDAERKAKEQAPLLVHDLRRSRVRNLIRANVPMTVAMKISGHKTAAVFSRYNITSRDDLERALAASQAYDAREATKPAHKPAAVIPMKRSA